MEARGSLTVAVFSIAVRARLSGRFDLEGKGAMSLAAVRRREDKNVSLTECLPMRRDVVLYSSVFLEKVGQMMYVDLERTNERNETRRRWMHY